jgi:hypothetical protein
MCCKCERMLDADLEAVLVGGTSSSWCFGVLMLATLGCKRGGPDERDLNAGSTWESAREASCAVVAASRG